MKYLLTLLGASLLTMSGCVTDKTTGKQSLDPNVRNAMLDVARSAVAGLEASYASSGKLNWLAAAQGAVGQAFTVETTSAVNGAVARVISDPGYAGAVTTAINSVAAAGAAKGLDDKSAILIGGTLLDSVLQAAKGP